MKRIIPVILLFITYLVGCGIALNALETENRNNILKVEVRMTKEDVNEIMGTKTVGYNDTTNPYKKESFHNANNNLIEIYYYIIDRKAEFDNDKFTPVVFVDNIVEGVGWRSFEDAERKYQIKISD